MHRMGVDSLWITCWCLFKLEITQFLFKWFSIGNPMENISLVKEVKFRIGTNSNPYHAMPNEAPRVQESEKLIERQPSKIPLYVFPCDIFSSRTEKKDNLSCGVTANYYSDTVHLMPVVLQTVASVFNIEYIKKQYWANY